MGGFVVEVWIVGFLIITEVDFGKQSGFNEERDGAVNSGAGGLEIRFADALPEFIGSEVLI